MQYVVLIEGEPGRYSAYSPDLPGCVAAGETRDETLALMRGAIGAHLAGLHEDGEEIPTPRTTAEYIAI